MTICITTCVYVTLAPVLCSKSSWLVIQISVIMFSAGVSVILPAVVIVWYRFEACSRCGGCEHTERSWDDGEGLGEILWGCRGTQAPTVERHQPWIQPHTSWRLRWPATSCMYQHHRPMIRMWRIPNLHPNPTESGTFPEIRNPSDT